MAERSRTHRSHCSSSKKIKNLAMVVAKAPVFLQGPEQWVSNAPEVASIGLSGLLLCSQLSNSSGWDWTLDWIKDS